MTYKSRSFYLSTPNARRISVKCPKPCVSTYLAILIILAMGNIIVLCNILASLFLGFTVFHTSIYYYQGFICNL